MPWCRREYAAQYRFESDRVQSIFAFWLLQYATKKKYAIEKSLQLDYSEGKPKIIGFEHLQFNLSHCKLAVACGLSAGTVGVVVQDWTREYFSIRKRVCCQQELTYSEEAKEPEIEYAKTNYFNLSFMNDE